MRALRIMLLTGMCIGLSGTSLFAKEVSPPPKYNEAILKKDFDAFMESVDMLTVSKDYPKAVRKLLSGDPEKQIQAVKTLAATGEIEVIPWLLLFLEAENKNLRIWTGSSLEKLVSSHVLKRRDMNMPEFVVIKSLRPGDRDLRPLAWVVLKMFRKPDDGNTHAYAASMTRYLGLHEFERELKQCLESRHPAVSNKAKWALESLERQKEYDAVFPHIKPTTVHRAGNLWCIKTYCRQRGIRRLGRDRVRLFIQPMGVVAQAVEVDLANRQLTVYPGTHSKKKIVQRQLDEEQTAKVRALVTSDEFEEIPRENKTMGFDGTSYLVEVRIDNLYSWKLHWLPDDKELIKVVKQIQAIARKQGN